MRQFLTWRFWCAIAGVLGLFLVVTMLQRNDDAIEIGPITKAPDVHIVDLVATVAVPRPSDDFAIVDGAVRGELLLDLDEQRTMRIYSGTLGEDQCGSLPEPSACAVVADLLGDAVIWFALVPAGQRNMLELPPITAFPRSGWARLSNGWELPLARGVTRVCDDDTTSLSDFVDRFGPTSTTLVDVTEGQITRVVCATS